MLMPSSPLPPFLFRVQADDVRESLRESNQAGRGAAQGQREYQLLRQSNQSLKQDLEDSNAENRRLKEQLLRMGQPQLSPRSPQSQPPPPPPPLLPPPMHMEDLAALLRPLAQSPPPPRPASRSRWPCPDAPRSSRSKSRSSQRQPSRMGPPPAPPPPPLSPPPPPPPPPRPSNPTIPRSPGATRSIASPAAALPRCSTTTRATRRRRGGGRH